MTQQKLLITLAIANIPVYFIVGKIMFNDLDGAKEAFGFWFTPMWIEALRGDGETATWSNLKVFVWLFICGAAVATEYFALAKHYVTA